MDFCDSKFHQTADVLNFACRLQKSKQLDDWGNAVLFDNDINLALSVRVCQWVDRSCFWSEGYDNISLSMRQRISVG